MHNSLSLNFTLPLHLARQAIDGKLYRRIRPQRDTAYPSCSVMRCQPTTLLLHWLVCDILGFTAAALFTQLIKAGLAHVTAASA